MVLHCCAGSAFAAGNAIINEAVTLSRLPVTRPHSREGTVIQSRLPATSDPQAAVGKAKGAATRVAEADMVPAAPGPEFPPQIFSLPGLSLPLLPVLPIPVSL